MKKFRLEEAQGLLPLVDSLLTTARTSYAETARLEEKAADLRIRIFHSGGLAVNVEAAFRDGADLKTRKAEVADALSELEAIGLQVKDLGAGIVDFPSDVDGETVLLCWKQGEDRITHWHGQDEGFSSRRKLDLRFTKDNQERSGPGRPGQGERLN